MIIIRDIVLAEIPQVVDGVVAEGTSQQGEDLTMDQFICWGGGGARNLYATSTRK